MTQHCAPGSSGDGCPQCLEDYDNCPCDDLWPKPAPYWMRWCATAFVMMALVTLVSGAVEVSAWAAWGSDKPPTPWFLYRFFLALCLCFSPFVALAVEFNLPQADQSPKGQDREDGLDAQHASGGAEGMRQKGEAA